MSGDADKTDAQQRWEEYQREQGSNAMPFGEWLRQDSDREMRKSQREGYQITAWAILFISCIVVAFAIAPDWAVVTLSLVLLVWGVWGVWNSMWPGRCVVCGRRTSFSGPSPSFRKPPPYMYWRPQPRSMSTYACPEHMGQVVLEW